MAAELDFSPPEIPEPTFMENVLRYGLFFGAIFQLICVLAIILPVSKSHKTLSHLQLLSGDLPPCYKVRNKYLSQGLSISEKSDLKHWRDVLNDSESFEPKNSETVKKPKATAPQISKKPKKETKKKR